MDSGDLVFYIILALSILVPLIGKRKEKPDDTRQPSSSRPEVSQPMGSPHSEASSPSWQGHKNKSSFEVTKRTNQSIEKSPVFEETEDRLRVSTSSDADQSTDSKTTEPSNSIHPEKDFQHLDEVKKALIYGEIMRTKF